MSDLRQAAIRELAERIDRADAIVIGGGSGLSSAAGYDHYHWSPALSEALAPFREHYGFSSPGDKPLLHQDTHTNPACGVGVNIQLALQSFYMDIQQAAENRMRQITLRDILDQYHARVKESSK